MFVRRNGFTESTSCDISCNEYVFLAGFEIVQRKFPESLFFVTVDAIGPHAAVD
jgi:hypothetical protein